MINQPLEINKYLFYETLIQSYVDSSRFIERKWLVEHIETELSYPNSDEPVNKFWQNMKKTQANL